MTIETLFYMLPIADWRVSQELERVDIELEVGLRMRAETDLGGARLSPPTESLRSRETSKNHG